MVRTAFVMVRMLLSVDTEETEEQAGTFWVTSQGVR